MERTGSGQSWNLRIQSRSSMRMFCVGQVGGYGGGTQLLEPSSLPPRSHTGGEMGVYSHNSHPASATWGTDILTNIFLQS